MKLFTNRLAFEPIDPLGDGLREAIEAAQRSPEAINLQEETRGETLVNAWDTIVHDIRRDPDWGGTAS